MKVIHIFRELKFSGAEIMYADAANLFINLGCELTALSTANQIGEFAPVLEKAGFKILHKPYPRTINYLARIRFYIAFIKFLKKESYDVIHVHRNDAMWGMALCGWITKKKVVYTFHNVFKSKVVTYPYYFLLRWTAKNIFKCKFQTISDSVFDNERYFYKNKTKKIYNWYSDKRFYPALPSEEEVFRDELNIHRNAFVLISIGGCSHIKRHSDIIKALPSIIKQVPNCIYLHLGDGETHDSEKELAKKLNVERHVIFCGNQVDVRKYLVASDVYLMPSKHEGIPITTIEAMGCKIPAILYDVPGLRDFNRSQQCSILIPEDYNILSEKVVYLRLNLIEGQQIANNAKTFVDDNFSLNTNAKEIFNLYKLNS